MTLLPEEQLRELIREELRKLNEEELIKFRRIDDCAAEREIESYIKRKKEKNIFKLSVFDIVRDLNIPPEQAERIMKKFEKEERISEMNA